MSKLLLAILVILLASDRLPAQKNCGLQLAMEQLAQADPNYKTSVAAFKTNQVQDAAQYAALMHSGAAFKTTASGVIPVVFHIILDSTQAASIGGVAGIEARLSSQMSALNADFAGTNADASKVPSVWTSIFARAGIRFGRAITDPNGNPTPGYEIRYVRASSSFNIDTFVKGAKSYNRGGLDPWDNTRYLNVWIVNIKSFSSGQILGVTVMPGLPGSTTADIGIALNYLAFGVRSSPSDKYINGSDLGRTLTHEMGHFFSLWHIWGDDDGACPWDAGGDDDGIADTPPQANQTYGVHSYPLYDNCSPASSSNGIMFMNYMDYSDDVCLYMFTREQSVRMNGQVATGGKLLSLTLHPELTGDSNRSDGVNVKVGPNPSKGVFNLLFNRDIDVLQSVRITDLNGKTVYLVQDQPSLQQIDLSGYPRGMYFLELRFSRTTAVKKIVLQ
jgi:hypothetical protein